MKNIFFIIFLCAATNAFCQKDTVLTELNPILFKKDFSEYDQQTALYCAQLSEVAYWNERNIEELYKKAKATYPDQNIHYTFIDDSYSIHNNQALLWGTKDFLVIAFRGTEPSVLKDWLTDSKYWNYENTDQFDDTLAHMPPGHGGFRRALMRFITVKRIKTEISAIIKRCNAGIAEQDFPIYLTGHSLGAGIAQLFIEPLNFYKFNFKGSYHFAPPLAVTCKLNSEFKTKYGNFVYDIVNFKDYVPRAGRNGVGHFGKFYRICDDGLIYKEDEAYVKFNLGEHFSEFRLHSLKHHTWLIRNKLNDVSSINSRSVGHFPCMELKGKPYKLCN